MLESWNIANYVDFHGDSFELCNFWCESSTQDTEDSSNFPHYTPIDVQCSNQN